VYQSSACCLCASVICLLSVCISHLLAVSVHQSSACCQCVSVICLLSVCISHLLAVCVHQSSACCQCASIICLLPVCINHLLAVCVHQSSACCQYVSTSTLDALRSCMPVSTITTCLIYANQTKYVRLARTVYTHRIFGDFPANNAV